MSDTKQQTRGILRTLIGTVVAAKSAKTVTVSITRLVKHPRYGKYIRKTMCLRVHDPNNTLRLGDKVQIAECRPISKTKSWRLHKLIERPEVVEASQ